MSSEGWGNGQQQPQHFGSRSYGNSNFRGAPRGGGGGGGRSYNNGGSGGWGGQQRGGAPGGGGGYGGSQGGYGGYGGQGRQNYGERQPRQNYGQGGGGGYGGYAEGSASSIEIDSNKVGMVIGRGGAKIREIQENFNVHVKIDRDPGQNGFTGVTIRGQDSAIESAKTYIQELVAAK